MWYIGHRLWKILWDFTCAITVYIQEIHSLVPGLRMYNYTERFFYSALHSPRLVPRPLPTISTFFSYNINKSWEWSEDEATLVCQPTCKPLWYTYLHSTVWCYTRQISGLSEVAQNVLDYDLWLFLCYFLLFFLYALLFCCIRCPVSYVTQLKVQQCTGGRDVPPRDLVIIM